MALQLKNLAESTLSASILSTDTQLTLFAGDGNLKFPTYNNTYPTAGYDYSWAALEDSSHNIEIIKIVGRNVASVGTDVLAILRAQEGTTALAFAAGSSVGIRFTAQTILDAAAVSGAAAAIAAVGNTLGYKNRVINGDFRIDQLQEQNAANLVAATNTMFADTWWMYRGTATGTTNAASGALSGGPLTGFNNQLTWNQTIVSGAPAAGDLNAIFSNIEGLNVQDLQWGTAAAKTVTMSFWVRSGVTGTYGFAINNSATNRSYVGQYTINNASTWEYKTITIPGDTAGTWLTTNGVGIEVNFDMGSGVNAEAAAANVWGAGNSKRIAGNVKLINSVAQIQFTGVQLELGSVATAFDFRDYASELVRCQRYYEKSFNAGVVPAQNAGRSTNAFGQIVGASTVATYFITSYKATKRANPTITFYNPGAANAQVRNATTGTDCSATAVNGTQGMNLLNLVTTSPAGSVVGQNLNVHWTADSRL